MVGYTGAQGTRGRSMISDAGWMRRSWPIVEDRATQESAHLATHEGSREVNGRPNIVLVHGAWADGSCWSEVIELSADGRIPAYGAAVPDELARRGRGAAAAGARAPGRPDHRRRPLLRRADHDRTRGRTPQRGRAGLRRRIRARRGRVAGRAALAGARSRRRWRTCSWTSGDSAGCPKRTSSNHFAADVDRSRARVMYAVQQPLASSAFDRRDGHAGVEVAAVVVPGRTERRGDPARRRAAVRGADGGDDGRDPIEPCGDGFAPSEGG